MCTGVMPLRDYVPVFEGNLAIASFLFSITSLLVSLKLDLPLGLVIGCELLYTAVLLFLARYPTKNPLIRHFSPFVDVVLHSHGIGLFFAVGTLMTVSGSVCMYFGMYAMSLAFFHISEYIVTALFNPSSLSVDSFLVNHSMEYAVAAIASWLEYWIELYFFPGLKSVHVISLIGLVLMIGGEQLRKLSMFTAASNFTHMVQYRKRQNHVLIKSGVYSIFRHPSYVGWFYWSIGSQLLLCNPVCVVGYAMASWRFFSERIYEEEKLLICFFREDYIEYKKRVGTGLPFISGFPIEDSETLLKYQM